MLQHYYFLVTIFTLGSVLVFHFIALGQTEASGLVYQASFAQTLACVVSRGKIRDFGFNTVAFQWSRDVKHKTNHVKRGLL